ncbi:MAG: DUF839 domain-containing protein [Pseudohongiella sp.]|nr:DUF839 domain-containing protein [Pseudohongiella sp.]MDO9520353.1 DUF839 domain-containing protein [Pseudohongiella sp.]MDP2126370.1 DUF839 domain-containing protein [Pseudohongiella sp.]
MSSSGQPVLSRRGLLKGGAMLATAGAAPFVQALQALSEAGASGAAPASRLADSPYGPIAPVNDEVTGLPLLQLPAGFSYASLSWTGDRMSNNSPVPARLDGMGVVAVQGDEIILIRNHEVGSGALIPAAACYSSTVRSNGNYAGGGNTTIRFSRQSKREISTVPSLSGTLVNCAGGVTPWGTWLSCEETIADLTADGGRKHGYVFEVRVDPAQTTAVPIVGMGRYDHEAAAVDPRDSSVYLTEDNRNESPLYRYIPDDKSQTAGALEKGGRLQAAKIVGRGHTELFTPVLGDTHQIEWVDIADPDMDPVAESSGPYLQARDAGALSFSRGEGIWYFEGMFYIVDTSAGTNEEGRAGYGEGAVWMLDPVAGTLRCIFASTSAEMANNPDNIAISPRGGIAMCEDGGGVEDAFGFGERIMGLQTSGDSFIFAKNNVVLTAEQITAAGKNCEPGDYRGGELAGVCFDPEGEIMFMNIQNPGVTVAIWGPWERGPL